MVAASEAPKISRQPRRILPLAVTSAALVLSAPVVAGCTQGSTVQVVRPTGQAPTPTSPNGIKQGPSLPLEGGGTLIISVEEGVKTADTALSAAQIQQAIVRAQKYLAGHATVNTVIGNADDPHRRVLPTTLAQSGPGTTHSFVVTANAQDNGFYSGLRAPIEAATLVKPDNPLRLSFLTLLSSKQVSKVNGITLPANDANLLNAACNNLVDAKATPAALATIQATTANPVEAVDLAQDILPLAAKTQWCGSFALGAAAHDSGMSYLAYLSAAQHNMPSNLANGLTLPYIALSSSVYSGL